MTEQMILNSSAVILVGFILASVRVYAEIMTYHVPNENKVGHFWQTVMKTSAHLWGEERAYRIHRFGLVMSVGYILLFSPQLLMS